MRKWQGEVVGWSGGGGTHLEEILKPYLPILWFDSLRRNVKKCKDIIQMQRE